MTRESSDVPFRDLVGATIATIEVIAAEWGRTYHSYVLVTTTDGRRAVLNSASGPKDAGRGTYELGRSFGPTPDVKDMKLAPGFFTAEDIAERVLADEKKSRQRREDEQRHKREQIERLRRELGEPAA